MRFSGQQPQNSRAQRANLLCASTVSTGQAATCEWWQPALRAPKKSRKSTQKQLQRELVIYMCMCVYIYIYCIYIFKYIYICIHTFIYLYTYLFDHFIIFHPQNIWCFRDTCASFLRELQLGHSYCAERFTHR